MCGAGRLDAAGSYGDRLETNDGFEEGIVLYERSRFREMVEMQRL